MLRKILDKVFLINKFTQCKTSRTLKIDLFEIPDNETSRRLFSKYELLVLDQGNSSSDPSQILILQFPIPRASLSSTDTPLQLNPHNTLHWFPFFILPILPCAIKSIEYTIPYARKWCKSSLQNGRCSFIFPTLFVHKNTLKSSLKMHYSTSVNFYLHIPPLLVHKIILRIPINNPFLYTSAIF